MVGHERARKVSRARLGIVGGAIRTSFEGSTGKLGGSGLKAGECTGASEAAVTGESMGGGLKSSVSRLEGRVQAGTLRSLTRANWLFHRRVGVGVSQGGTGRGGRGVGTSDAEVSGGGTIVNDGANCINCW